MAPRGGPHPNTELSAALTAGIAVPATRAAIRHWAATGAQPDRLAILNDEAYRQARHVCLAA